MGLAPAAGLIFGVGLLDDLFVLKPYQKFAVQFLAAGLAKPPPPPPSKLFRRSPPKAT